MHNLFKFRAATRIFLKTVNITSIASIVLCTSAFALTSSTSSQSEKFISFSDIHFDPFASCKLTSVGNCVVLNKLRNASTDEWEGILDEFDSNVITTYRNDTNHALLKSSLAQLSAVNREKNLAFTIILGDFLAHNYREQYILYSGDTTYHGYEEFVKKTLQYLTKQIREAIPNGDIYPVVGNNDSYIGDYGAETSDSFYTDTKATWAPFIKDSQNQESFSQKFATAGYYAVTVPSNPHQRIIVLNTILFSSLAAGSNVTEAADEQMRWLHTELQAASDNSQSVILAFHIPVGVDVFKTIKNPIGTTSEFWEPKYNEKFRAELKEFSDVVSAVLVGHIHMDGFQLVNAGQSKEIPVSFTPSISPFFGNNPGFKIYNYDDTTVKLKNFDTYYYPLNEENATWKKEYNFNDTYQSTCEGCDLTHGMKKLASHNELVSVYKKYYSVGNSQPVIQDHNWMPYYWCDINSISGQDYKACVNAA